MYKHALFILAACALHAGSAAAADVVGTITRSGIYEMVGPPKGPWKIGSVSEAERIPARQGVHFGIDFEVSGIAEATASFTTITRHPSFAKPGQAPSTMETETMGPFTVKQGKVTSSLGFGFDHPYERVPGEWRFEILYQGHVVAAKSFTVIAD
jgi:hypothetical protein